MVAPASQLHPSPGSAVLAKPAMFFFATFLGLSEVMFFHISRVFGNLTSMQSSGVREPLTDSTGYVALSVWTAWKHHQDRRRKRNEARNEAIAAELHEMELEMWEEQEGIVDRSVSQRACNLWV